MFGPFCYSRVGSRNGVMPFLRVLMWMWTLENSPEFELRELILLSVRITIPPRTHIHHFELSNHHRKIYVTFFWGRGVNRNACVNVYVHKYGCYWENKPWKIIEPHRHISENKKKITIASKRVWIIYEPIISHLISFQLPPSCSFKTHGKINIRSQQTHVDLKKKKSTKKAGR